MKQTETLVAQVPQTAPEDEQQLNREVTDIEFQAESMVILSDDDYTSAGEFGKMLKQKAAQVTSFFKPMKDSAYQAHKAICDREKAMLTPLKNAEKTVKKAMGDYFAEQERKRQRLRGSVSSRKLLRWSRPAIRTGLSPPCRRPWSWTKLRAIPWRPRQSRRCPASVRLRTGKSPASTRRRSLCPWPAWNCARWTPRPSCG